MLLYTYDKCVIQLKYNTNKGNMYWNNILLQIYIHVYLIEQQIYIYTFFSLAQNFSSNINIFKGVPIMSHQLRACHTNCDVFTINVTMYNKRQL